MKILVTEDNPVTKKLLSNILKKIGHDVISVTDGPETWEIY